MSLSGHEFYTKNKDLQRYIDILTKDFYVELPTNLAQEFSRHKIVQKARELDRITIAEDHRYKRSSIKVKDNLCIKKDGNKYFFEFFI